MKGTGWLLPVWPLQTFHEQAIAKAVMFSKQPPEDFVDQVMKLLDNDTALGNRT